MISKISGCYSITLYGQTQHFFVMDYLFAPHICPAIHEKFDLKGSWVDRHEPSEANRKRTTLAGGAPAAAARRPTSDALLANGSATPASWRRAAS